MASTYTGPSSAAPELGRTVVALMSDNHIDPDVAVEVFVLAPAEAARSAAA
jgi:hypothetical protein